MNTKLILWQNPEKSVMPSNITDLKAVVTFANSSNLSSKQQAQIVDAYNRESYEMAAEYAWKKAITKLRKSLASLGIDFVAELLQRSDIDEYSSIEDVVSERKAIELAEQLGIIGKTGALKLRQSQELVAHYISGDADVDIDSNDAFNIIKNSIQYILSEQSVDVAVSFSRFRKKILSQTITLSDSDVKQILIAPLFYLRTVCTILLTAIKNEKGAHQEHALTNINVILPEIWEKLADVDKYHIGETYSKVSASGDNVATKGLKQALGKVFGFDYVPETLRSTTFRDHAKKLIDTHYGYNNFYNEIPLVKALSSLGSIIPQPAFQECLDAYLLVYMGNYYGYSTGAAPIAERELVKISKDRWRYFFEKVIHQDQYVLSNFSTSLQVYRFADILQRVGFVGEMNLPKESQLLYNAIMRKDVNIANNIATTLWKRLY